MNRDSYFEDSRARCLNEHYPHQSDDLYLIMCGLENCSPDKEVWDHVRIGYHLHVIMSGEGVIQVGDRRQSLHAGQLFLIKPGEQMMYRPRPENPWTYCWMTFDGARASSYIEEAGFTPGVNSLNSHVDISRFYHKCDRVMSIPQLSMAAALRRLGLTMEFISLAVESYDISMRDVRGKHKALYNQADYVNHAKDYILNNYSSINVADISMYLGIDRSYFSAIFKQTEGITPSEYLLQVRMRKSTHMLRNPTLSIQEIARNVGYEDSLTFSKAFKRFFGVSPKYYRIMPADDRPELDAITAARRENAKQE